MTEQQKKFKLESLEKEWSNCRRIIKYLYVQLHEQQKRQIEIEKEIENL